MKKYLEIMNFYKAKTLTFCRNTTAAIAIMFALMAPMVVGSAGLALDYAHAYLVYQRLAQAIDAAALAGAASSDNPDEIRAKVIEFFNVNYPPEKVGFTIDPVVTVTDNQVIVNGTAYYLTSFLGILGIDQIDVSVDTTVNREIQAIEVVLVLDNTGSMDANNNILKLKKASKNFVDIMFSATSNNDLVKIGLVPYANSVRIGSYGIGKNPDGSVYNDGETFVNLPAGMTYTNSHNHTNKNQWFGCVLEYNEDGYDASSKFNDPYPYDVVDDHEGPWDIYQYQQAYSMNRSSFDYYVSYGYEGICTSYNSCYIYVDYNYPAQDCPYAQIVPLTSDYDMLVEAIGDPDNYYDGMRAHGHTLGNVGIAWGQRLISPEAPFEEGSDWDNLYWKKAIIFMTDGANTVEANYSSFWRRRNHQMNTTTYNERMAETCQDLKDKGVLIYTVTFTGGANESTREYYKNCATTEDYYKHTNDPDELVTVFEDIARELSILHISQ